MTSRSRGPELRENDLAETLCVSNECRRHIPHAGDVSEETISARSCGRRRQRFMSWPMCSSFGHGARFCGGARGGGVGGVRWNSHPYTEFCRRLREASGRGGARSFQAGGLTFAHGLWFFRCAVAGTQNPRAMLWRLLPFRVAE